MWPERTHLINYLYNIIYYIIYYFTILNEELINFLHFDKPNYKHKSIYSQITIERASWVPGTSTGPFEVCRFETMFFICIGLSICFPKYIITYLRIGLTSFLQLGLICLSSFIWVIYWLISNQWYHITDMRLWTETSDFDFFNVQQSFEKTRLVGQKNLSLECWKFSL